MSLEENQPLLIDKVMERMALEKKRRRPYWLRYVILILFNIPYTASFSILYQFCYGVIADKNGLFFDTSGSNNSDSNYTYCGQKINVTQSGLQAQVDSETSNWLLYYSLVSGIPAILTTIVFGSLSDYVGRKFMFLVCNIGMFLKLFVLVVMVKMNLDLAWGYLGSVFEGISGSGFVLLLASFAYTADVTSVGVERQFGVALMEGINSVAGGAASFAIGYIINSLGFFVPTVICCSIMLINIFIIAIFLPETIDTAGGSVRYIPDGIKNMVNLYKNDDGKRRRGKLLTLLLAFAVFLHSLLGTSGVSTIFELSEPFCFSSSDLGIYGAMSSIATNFIGIPLMKVYQRCMSAPIIAAFGTIFDMAGNLVTAFAVNKFIIFCVPVLDIFLVVVSPMIRGAMSNLVNAKEQGALFGSIAAVEATSYFTGSSLASAIYSHTVAQLRGAVYLCFCAFDVSCILLLLFYWFKYSTKSNVIQHVNPDHRGSSK